MADGDAVSVLDAVRDAHESASEVVRVWLNKEDGLAAFVDEAGGIIVVGAQGKRRRYQESVYRALAEAEERSGGAQPAKTLTALNLLLDEFGGRVAAGLDEVDSGITFEPYDGSSDALWEEIRGRFGCKSDRELHVVTFGMQISGWRPDIPREAQFDASVLSAKATPEMRRLRGTDPRLQTSIRAGPGFKEFMESVVRDIEENDRSKVAIYCQAGHHRSVACAELLEHLYPKRTVDHIDYNNSKPRRERRGHKKHHK